MVAVLACTLAYAVAAPRIAGRIGPAVAIWMLVPASLLFAAAGTFAVAVAAFTLIGQFPEIAEMGRWSPATLRSDAPIPPAAAGGGLVLLTYATMSAIVLVSRRSRALMEVHRSCGRLGAPGSVVIVESDTPNAFTTPEITGRIIVTRGMLNALAPGEREALFAHEASHLRHRHAWWLFAADLAAAINPALRAIAQALRQTVERWADEDAVDAVRDRRTVAHAVAHAALAAHAYRSQPAATTAATSGDVPARVAALLAPRARRARPAIVAVAISVLLLGATGAATLAVQRDGERLFERVIAAQEHRTDAKPAARHITTAADADIGRHVR
jgi:Zn-dependent protease with chaperone function